jgi:cytochrome c553
MRHRPGLLLFALLLVLPCLAQKQAPPSWAYPLNPPSTAAEPADNSPHRVPGSDATFTTAQLHDLYTAPDWHPAAHPAMPEIVARGRKPDVYACAYCHLPNGLGRPENASLASLPPGYIIRQVEDFKTGVRKSSEPRHAPTATMISAETKATAPELQAAADYFSRLERKRWIRVVETSTVPTTHVAGWMLVANTPTTAEPIGQRIIEMPENLERTELRDDTSGFIAYVPEGSLKRGKLLAVTGDSGRTVPCAKCHGPGLRGTGNIPGIAGRSPSYLVRQLFDIQSGARRSSASQPMRPQVVAKLTIDDMIALAAYIASLRP